MIMVGFTKPNRYQPRKGWEDRLLNWQGTPPPPAAGWQTDMIMYWSWRKNDDMELMDAWKKLGMRPANARTALDPHSGKERGLIPPEIFSRVLARSRAEDIDPDDNVDEVVIEDAG
jgi:hypothetical protein